MYYNGNYNVEEVIRTRLAPLRGSPIRSSETNREIHTVKDFILDPSPRE